MDKNITITLVKSHPCDCTSKVKNMLIDTSYLWYVVFLCITWNMVY